MVKYCSNWSHFELYSAQLSMITFGVELNDEVPGEVLCLSLSELMRAVERKMCLYLCIFWFLLPLLEQVESPTSHGASGVKSFSISDILSHKPNNNNKNCRNSSIDVTNVVVQQRIVRPWDPQSKNNGRRNSSDSSPLDALFQMTSKTFEGLNGHHENSGKLISYIDHFLNDHSNCHPAGNES